MIRFMVVTTLLWCVPVGSGAQEAPWPPAVVEQVVAALAEQIGARPDGVVLEWGPYRGGPVALDGPVEVRGRGTHGYWMARTELAEGGPVSVRVRAGHVVERRVAARHIERGAVLGFDDIMTDEIVTWGRSPSSHAEVEMGWIAQRPLRPGDELTPPAVRAPLAVQSGRPVEITWRRSGVRVTVSGTAAESGSIGARVAVRTHTGRRLTGVVEADGVVDVSSSGDTPRGGAR